MLKKHVEKHESPTEQPKHEQPKNEDPKDKRIRQLTDCLLYLKEFAVQGNVNHVKAIESALVEN